MEYGYPAKALLRQLRCRIVETLFTIERQFPKQANSYQDRLFYFIAGRLFSLLVMREVCRPLPPWCFSPRLTPMIEEER
jgi:hypothetical protein